MMGAAKSLLKLMNPDNQKESDTWTLTINNHRCELEDIQIVRALSRTKRLSFADVCRGIEGLHSEGKRKPPPNLHLDMLYTHGENITQTKIEQDIKDGMLPGFLSCAKQCKGPFFKPQRTALTQPTPNPDKKQERREGVFTCTGLPDLVVLLITLFFEIKSPINASDRKPPGSAPGQVLGCANTNLRASACDSSCQSSGVKDRRLCGH